MDCLLLFSEEIWEGVECICEKETNELCLEHAKSELIYLSEKNILEGHQCVDGN